MEKINPVRHGFTMEPVRDVHAHLCFAKPIEETVEAYKNILHHFHYATININALPAHDCMLDNYKTAYCKLRLSPLVYASAGLEHYGDERDTKAYYLEQIKEYHAMGFDGMKMLEGKVSLYRKIRRAVNDRRLDDYYAYAEEHAIPILMHVGDPASCWDKSMLSDYAIQKGWFYDETEPTREDVRGWVSDVLSRFPKLHLILAHFYFMSYELDRAAKLLDTYENVCFDLTPGGEMFVAFTKNYDAARAFFEKYQDRLLYGTDMYNFFENPDRAESEIGGPRVFEVRSFLEKTEEFIAPLLSDQPLRPFGFTGEILNKIYRNNFVRIYGQTPRPMDAEKILHAMARVPEKAALDALESENMRVIEAHIKKYIRANLK